MGDTDEESYLVQGIGEKLLNGIYKPLKREGNPLYWNGCGDAESLTIGFIGLKIARSVVERKGSQLKKLAWLGFSHNPVVKE